MGCGHIRTLEADLPVCECVFLAVLGSGAGSSWALGRQQRGLEGAGAGALTRGEHLAGEMMKGVVSFWGGTDPSVRTCSQTQAKL